MVTLQFLIKILRLLPFPLPLSSHFRTRPRFRTTWMKCAMVSFFRLLHVCIHVFRSWEVKYPPTKSGVSLARPRRTYFTSAACTIMHQPGNAMQMQSHPSLLPSFHPSISRPEFPISESPNLQTETQKDRVRESGVDWRDLFQTPR